MAAHHDTPTDSTQMRAVCDHNQVAVNHLLRLLHLSYFGSPRYKNTILKAVRSVCVYPLPIETEKDALSLNGVGKYLAKEIMKSFNVSRSNETPSLTSQTEISPAEPVYKPEQGRGPWAVMIALRLLNGSGTKESIINCIRSHNVEVSNPLVYLIFADGGGSLGWWKMVHLYSNFAKERYHLGRFSVR